MPSQFTTLKRQGIENSKKLLNRILNNVFLDVLSLWAWLNPKKSDAGNTNLIVRDRVKYFFDLFRMIDWLRDRMGWGIRIQRHASFPIANQKAIDLMLSTAVKSVTDALYGHFFYKKWLYKNGIVETWAGKLLHRKNGQVNIISEVNLIQVILIKSTLYYLHVKDIS